MSRWLTRFDDVYVNETEIAATMNRHPVAWVSIRFGND